MLLELGLVLCVFPLFSAALMFNLANFKESAVSHDKVVVCYWGSWSNYRPGLGKFNHQDVDASLCTHLVYSFAGIDQNTSTIKSLDEWMDLVIKQFFSTTRKVLILETPKVLLPFDLS